MSKKSVEQKRNSCVRFISAATNNSKLTEKLASLQFFAVMVMEMLIFNHTETKTNHVEEHMQFYIK